MAKERPILFSGPMVRAILAGTKTQTRRLIKPQPNVAPELEPLVDEAWQTGFVNVECPHGEPGDRLWVRESHRVLGWDEGGSATIQYLADGARRVVNIEADDADEWALSVERAWRKSGAIVDADGLLSMPDGRDPPGRPSIFLERWASRIVLEITDVRVERLQAITEEDARAEGVRARDAAIVFQAGAGEIGARIDQALSNTARGAFACLWDAINGTRASWASSPWVWAISFKRVEAE